MYNVSYICIVQFWYKIVSMYDIVAHKLTLSDIKEITISERQANIIINTWPLTLIFKPNVGHRKDWMIYRGTSFLTVVWFGSRPAASPFPVKKLSLFFSLPVCRRSSLLMGKGGRRRAWILIKRQESLVLYKLFNPLWFTRCGFHLYNLAQSIEDFLRFLFTLDAQHFLTLSNFKQPELSFDAA